MFASVPEVAAITGNDPRTIRRAAAAGEIPAHRVGAQWKIPTQWLREQAAQITPAAQPEVDYDRLADLVTERMFARFAAIFGKSGAVA